MLSEIILGVVIGVLLLDKFLYSKEMNKQVRELAKLVKSKDSIEYVTSQKIEQESKEPKEDPEYILAEDMSDTDFFKNIRKQINQDA